MTHLFHLPKHLLVLFIVSLRCVPEERNHGNYLEACSTLCLIAEFNAISQ